MEINTQQPLKLKWTGTIDELSIPSVRYAISSLTVGRNSTKFGVWVTHMNGACNNKFFWPRPLGPWGGVKGQISFNFYYKVNFKDF